MENHIDVVSYKGKTYFEAYDSTGKRFLFSYISAWRFVGEDKEEVYFIEAHRKGSIMLSGEAWFSSQGNSIINFLYSEISGLSTSSYPECVQASYFKEGDIVSSQISVGTKIADGFSSWISLSNKIHDKIEQFRQALQKTTEVNYRFAEPHGWEKVDSNTYLVKGYEWS